MYFKFIQHYMSRGGCIMYSVFALEELKYGKDICRLEMMIADNSKCFIFFIFFADDSKN